MPLATTVKNLSIVAGLYRYARWLSRRLRPAQLRAHLDDIRFYRSLLPSGALCFDVGANIGEKSEALLKAGARVVAFEPNPLVLPELRARCSYQKNWTIVAAALGSGAAISTLYACQAHSGSSLDRDWPGKVIGTYNVPVVTLDAAIQMFGKPFYCKIDVEGWELEVLKGLTQPLPLLSFEFNLSSKHLAKTLACLERLMDFGPSHVNLTPAEDSTFYLQEWVLLEQFIKWFPGDLKRSLPGALYGDIFIKNTTFVSDASNTW
jgi:FkbM family methyltransferase